MPQTIMEELDQDLLELDEVRPPEFSEILSNIWLQPRVVFEAIHRSRYEGYMTVLLVLAGIGSGFDNASSRNLGDTFGIWGVIAIAIIAGGLFGWISYYIYAGLLSWTGKWYGGNADFRSILRVIVYAQIPSIAAIAILFLQIPLFGEAIFTEDGFIDSDNTADVLLFYGSIGIELSLSLWTVVLSVVGLAVVQKLSYGKAFLNLITPILFFVVIGLIAFLLFMA